MSDTTNGATAPQQNKGFALATREERAVARADPRAFEPANFQEAASLAVSLCRSGLMPSGLDTPEKVTVAIMMGRELGMTVMQSVRLIHVIEGKPCLSAQGIVGLVKASGACKYFRCVETTDQIATYETLRVGAPEPVRMSYTHEQAKNAGLMNPTRSGKPSNHVKFPAAMLRARCETALARSEYPDVVGGLYDPDELTERVEPRDVTPVREARPPVAPAPRAAPAEVIAEARETTPPPPAKPDPDDDGRDPEPVLSEAGRALVARANAATVGTDLDAIAKDANAGKRAGEITPEDMSAIKAAVQAKRAALAGA